VYLSGPAVSTTSGFGCSSLVSPLGLAVDQNGYIDIADNGSAENVKKFNPNGTLNATFTATSFSGVNGISIDGAGDIWVANFNGSLNKSTELLPAGTEATHSPFTTGYGNVDIAAGPLAVWETNYNSNYISRIDLTTFAVTTVNIGGPQGGVAIDHNNNAWIAVTGNGNVFESNNAGTLLSPYGGYVFVNGNVQNIAVDGLGNIFCGGYLGSTSMGSLVEFNNAGTNLGPDSGFSGSNVIPNTPQPPEGIAIDGSGNVWIAGTTQGTLPNYVAEVIGIAAPVVTPRATAVTNNTLGTRP
jgi:streptogramin lyase